MTTDTFPEEIDALSEEIDEMSEEIDEMLTESERPPSIAATFPVTFRPFPGISSCCAAVGD